MNLNFRAKNQWFVLIFIHWFSITFWIFAQKLSKFDYFQFFDNSVFDHNHNFWRKNSNHLGIFFFQLKIHGFFTQKIQNFVFSWKLNFWKNFVNFLQCGTKYKNSLISVFVGSNGPKIVPLLFSWHQFSFDSEFCIN